MVKRWSNLQFSQVERVVNLTKPNQEFWIYDSKGGKEVAQIHKIQLELCRIQESVIKLFLDVIIIMKIFQVGMSGIQRPTLDQLISIKNQDRISTTSSRTPN